MPQSALIDLVMRSILLCRRASGATGGCGGCAQTCAAAINTSANLNGMASPRQKFVEKQMEMVHTVLALHREPALVVGSRLQSALHVLADPDIFLLDLIAERDRLRRHCPG